MLVLGIPIPGPCGNPFPLNPILGGSNVTGSVTSISSGFFGGEISLGSNGGNAPAGTTGV